MMFSPYSDIFSLGFSTKGQRIGKYSIWKCSWVLASQKRMKTVSPNPLQFLVISESLLKSSAKVKKYRKTDRFPDIKIV